MSNHDKCPPPQLSKNTNIISFLKAVPHLETPQFSMVELLARRFEITPESLAFLINVAAMGGAFYEN